MNEVLRWHDEVFLHFVQTDYFGRPWLAGALVVLLLIVPPVHRRFAQLVIGLTTLWVALTIVVYGVLREVPVLACVTVVAAVMSWLRGVMWSVPEVAPPGKSTGGLWTKLHPRGSWIAGVVRDYFRVDPRGVYWLDLARARRGRRPKRSPRERREALPTAFELPQWRISCWQRVVFPVVELRLWIWRRLPRYWQHEHHDLDLQEPHVQTVLRQEIADATRLSDEHETAPSFIDFCKRTSGSVEHEQAMELAGRYGRKVCLLTEASIEARLFADDWPADEKRLCEIADSVIELWRYRRGNDRLWALELEVRGAVQSGGRPQTVPSASRGSWGFRTTAEGHAGPKEHRAKASKTAEVSAVEIVTDSPATVAESETVDDFELELESDREVGGTVVDEPSNEELVVDPDQEEAGGSAPLTRVDRTSVATSGTRLLGRLGGLFAARKKESARVSDAEVFALVSDERESEAMTTSETTLSLIEADRVRDLQLACRILEAYLKFEPQTSLAATAQAAQRLLDRPVNWPAVTRLLMLYCLRSDLTGDRQERAKGELIGRQMHWVRGLLGQDELVKSVKQVFFDLLIDWHSVRGGYTQIRELFGHSEPRGARQWELLGLAEAHLANQMKDRESLRDTLVRDAAAKLFQARVRGFWTQRYAGLLLGTGSSVETISLLGSHTVQFGRSDLDRALDQMPALPPRPILRDVVGEVLEVGEPDDPPARPAAPVRNRPAVTENAPAPREARPKPAPPAAKARPAKPEPIKPAAAKPAVVKPAAVKPAAVKPVAAAQPADATKRTPAPPLKVTKSTPAAAQIPTLSLVKLSTKQQLFCKKFPVTFGSVKDECQIRSPKLEVRHCEIVKDNGRYVMISHTDKNRVRVNDLAVITAARLENGDVITVGEMKFQVLLS